MAVSSAAALQPLEALYEAPGQPELPDELLALYGGPLGFPEPRLYANFVATTGNEAPERHAPDAEESAAGRGSGGISGRCRSWRTSPDLPTRPR